MSTLLNALAMSQILIAIAFSVLFGLSDSIVFANRPVEERELLRFEEARETPSFDGEDIPVDPTPQRVVCGGLNRNFPTGKLLVCTTQRIEDLFLLGGAKETSPQRTFSQKDLYQRQEVYRL